MRGVGSMSSMMMTARDGPPGGCGAEGPGREVLVRFVAAVNNTNGGGGGMRR